jgi:hypothetical protein
MKPLSKQEPPINGKDYACGPNRGDNADVEIGRFGFDRTPIDPQPAIDAQMAEARADLQKRVDRIDSQIKAHERSLHEPFPAPAPPNQNNGKPGLA